jgi:hypothetical protein
MPLGSSSAAPVIKPGPKILRTFEIEECDLPRERFFSPPVVSDFASEPPDSCELIISDANVSQDTPFLDVLIWKLELRNIRPTNHPRSSCVLDTTLKSLIAILFALLLRGGALLADPIPVRHQEGTLHGFLSIRTPEGRTIATGDLIQVPDEERVTCRLLFRFKDGSIEDETTVFSQHKIFRLISDHLVEKGPSFPDPVDMSLETASGNVTVHRTDGEGKDRMDTFHFDFPPDLANGLVLTLLKNISWDTAETKVSYLAPGSKPVLVKLAISPGGQEKFSIQGAPEKANRFIVRPEIEGIPGLLTSIFGKQPPDTYVWILGGEAPTFLRLQTPAYEGGPIWITELASPQ